MRSIRGVLGRQPRRLPRRSAQRGPRSPRGDLHDRVRLRARSSVLSTSPNISTERSSTMNSRIPLITLLTLSAGCADSLTEDFGIDITSPGDGTVVSGVVTVSARAWDTADVVTSVQFDLPDG